MSQTEIEWDADDEAEEKPFNRAYMARMLGYLKPYKRVMGAVVVIVLLNMALSLAEPLLLAYIIDDGVLKGDFAVIHAIGLALLGARLLSWLFGYFHTKFINFTDRKSVV